jgi:hypothetical protein
LPRVLIPPKKNSRVRPATPTARERNRNIRSRARLGRRGSTGNEQACRVHAVDGDNACRATIPKCVARETFQLRHSQVRNS